VLHIVSLVPVQQSGYIPRCEANRPCSLVGVLDEVVRGVIAVVLNVHRPVEKILGILLRRLEDMCVWSTKASLTY